MRMALFGLSDFSFFDNENLDSSVMREIIIPMIHMNLGHHRQLHEKVH